MPIVRKIFLFPFLLLVVHSCAGQDIHTKKQVKEDLNVLRKVIVETDPALSQKDRKSLNEIFKKQIDSFNQTSTTTLQFIEYFSKINPGRKAHLDEHASLNWSKPLPDSALLFPIPIEIIDSSIVVNSDSVSIPFGGIILSINGVRINMQEFLRKDSISNFEKVLLKNQFSLFYYFAHGSFPEFTVTYKLKPNSTETKSVIIKAVDQRRYFQLMNTSVFPLSNNWWRNETNVGYLQQIKTGYLRINSFIDLKTHFPIIKRRGDTTVQFKEPRQSFETLFDSIFTDIKNKNVENLVIDIRNNGGGDISIPGLLLSYIYDKSFADVHKMKMPLISDVPLDNMVAIDAKNVNSKSDVRKTLYRLYDGFHKDEDAYIVNTWNIISSKPNAFKGNLYLLVNEGTFSAAAYFTALFKYYTKGKIIGEEVGGSHLNLTAGHTLTYQLPNNKLKVNMPTTFISFNDSIAAGIPEKYIKPDIHFSTKEKYEYFYNRKDISMQTALTLIYENLNSVNKKQ